MPASRSHAAPSPNIARRCGLPPRYSAGATRARSTAPGCERQARLVFTYLSWPGFDPAIPLKMARLCLTIGIAGSSPVMTAGKVLVRHALAVAHQLLTDIGVGIGAAIVAAPPDRIAVGRLAGPVGAGAGTAFPRRPVVEAGIRAPGRGCVGGRDRRRKHGGDAGGCGQYHQGF